MSRPIRGHVGIDYNNRTKEYSFGGYFDLVASSSIHLNNILNLARKYNFKTYSISTAIDGNKFTTETIEVVY